MKSLGIFVIVFLFALICIDLVYTAPGQCISEQTQKPSPNTIEIDRNYDGKIDRLEYYEGSILSEVHIDADFDGIFEEIDYYKSGKLIRVEKDTNKDGKIDYWISY